MNRRERRSFFLASFLLPLALAIPLLPLAGSGEAEADAAPDASNEAPALTLDSGVEVLLLRLGFGPRAVAAIGLEGSGLQTVLATHQDALEAVLEGLAARDGAYSQAKLEVDTLRRKVRSGLATPEEVLALAAAKQSLQEASAAREGFLDAVFETVCEHLPQALREKLVRIRANRRWNHLPIQYLVTERTEAEWILLRDALAAKRTHERVGDGVPQAALDLLGLCDADGSVSAALANRNANLPGVQASWNAIFVH